MEQRCRHPCTSTATCTFTDVRSIVAAERGEQDLLGPHAERISGAIEFVCQFARRRCTQTREMRRNSPTVG